MAKCQSFGNSNDGPWHLQHSWMHRRLSFLDLTQKMLTFLSKEKSPSGPDPHRAMTESNQSTKSTQMSRYCDACLPCPVLFYSSDAGTSQEAHREPRQAFPDTSTVTTPLRFRADEYCFLPSSLFDENIGFGLAGAATATTTAKGALPITDRRYIALSPNVRTLAPHCSMNEVPCRYGNKNNNFLIYA